MLPGEKAALLACAHRVARWAHRQAETRSDFSPTRAGLCALASARLCAELAQAGFSPVVRVVHTARLSGHCYVECQGLLLDVTATQFSRQGQEFASVEVHPVDAPRRHEFWSRGRLVCHSLRELQQALTRHRWPKSQVPTVPR